MTASAALAVSVKKEARALWPAWAACVAALSAFALPGHGNFRRVQQKADHHEGCECCAPGFCAKAGAQERLIVPIGSRWRISGSMNAIASLKWAARA